MQGWRWWGCDVVVGFVAVDRASETVNSLRKRRHDGRTPRLQLPAALENQQKQVRVLVNVRNARIYWGRWRCARKTFARPSRLGWTRLR